MRCRHVSARPSEAGAGRAALALLLLVATGCAGTDDPGAAAGEASDEQTFPDVLAAEVDCTAAGPCAASATLSSPYDTPDRYADAFRVRTPGGEVLGVRELAHDHAAEQPFTRSLSDVDVPEEVTEVVVQGRDLAHGWGGATVTVPVRR